MDAEAPASAGWQSETILKTTDDVEAAWRADFRWFSFNDRSRPVLKDRSKSWRHGSLRLGYMATTGYEMSRNEAEAVVFMTPLAGRSHLTVPHGEFTIEPGQMLVAEPNLRRLVTRANEPEPYRHLALIMSPTVLGDWADVLGDGARRLDGRTWLASSGQPLPARGLISAMQTAAEVPPTYDGHDNQEHVSVLLTDRILSLLTASAAGASRQGSLRQLRIAEAFIHANFREPLSTPLIARQAGLSIRGLQAMFLRHRGVTPLTYLRRVRLEAAHAELAASRGERRITDIAMDCGFVHLGRFATAYRERFGERPSVRWRDDQFARIRLD